jgi:hypothetical protein
MENNLVLNNANAINDNLGETNINRIKISSKKSRFSPAIFNIVNEPGKILFHFLYIIGLAKKPNSMVSASKFLYLGIVIEEFVLLILLFIYFIFGATAVILYVIFCEQLYEKLFVKGKKEKHKSLYDYKRGIHNLKLNWEE